jgi:hypothetical protein
VVVSLNLSDPPAFFSVSRITHFLSLTPTLQVKVKVKVKLSKCLITHQNMKTY